MHRHYRNQELDHQVKFLEGTGSFLDSSLEAVGPKSTAYLALDDADRSAAFCETDDCLLHTMFRSVMPDTV